MYGEGWCSGRLNGSALPHPTDAIKSGPYMTGNKLPNGRDKIGSLHSGNELPNKRDTSLFPMEYMYILDAYHAYDHHFLRSLASHLERYFTALDYTFSLSGS